MLTAHAIWAGNRQPPHGQNCGTLKDDTNYTMIALCLHHCDYGQGITLEPPIQFGHLSGYNTRTETTFAHSLRCHLSYSQHFFRHSVIKFWNSLPLDIRDYLHFSDYKNELKTFLLTGL